MFDKLYSKSGFIRDLAFKKLFIDNYDLLFYVVMKTLNSLNLPMNSDITVLDNLVSDKVTLKKKKLIYFMKLVII